tara:strand:- start:2698 stop:3357 length:660 start_codon:yes stop_codon:yes gene_type:complete
LLVKILYLKKFSKLKRAAAILLAAGESSRMKTIKALLPWCHTNLLGYSVDSIIKAGYSPLVVVLGYEATRLKPHIPISATTVVNKDYLTGKSSSIIKGIKTLESLSLNLDSVLITSVDQPRSVELLSALREAMQNSTEGTLIASPISKGRIGHPTIFNSSLQKELLEISEESKGVRSIVSRHQDKRLLVSTNDPLALTNLNTLSDYQATLHSMNPEFIE